MLEISMSQAKPEVANLLNMISTGKEVVVTRENGYSFSLVALPIIVSNEQQKQARPKFGSAKGKIKMSDDFDEPLSEFFEYFPNDSQLIVKQN